MTQKTAHLDMIQGVINRMSVNSFLLKGWSVVLISALFALAAAQEKREFILLAYFPGIAFWVLDGYFLRQEKLFRKLYDRVRGLAEDAVDFSMDTAIVSSQVPPWERVIFSHTLVIFHGVVIGAIVVVMFLLPHS